MAKKKATPPGRTKTPTLIQMEAVECGAAALGILARYHGLWEPLEKLRVECGVSRDGSKASNILSAAEALGFEARGFKLELSELYRLEPPLILFWNFNHFVVFEGYDRKRVFINDPATGPRTISHTELDESFTGVTLQIKPGGKFKKGGTKPSLVPAVARRLSGSRKVMALVMLAGLLLVVPGLVVPGFTRIFVDEYLIGGKSNWVKPLLLCMAAATVLSMALTYAQQLCLLRFETKLALTSSLRFFHHVVRLPIEFFSQRFAADIGLRVQTNDKVAHILSEKITISILEIGLIVFYGGLMLFYNFILGSLCIALSLLSFVILKAVSRKRTDLTRILLQETGKMEGVSVDGLEMIETIKACGGEDEFFSRWAGYQTKTLRAQQDLELITKFVNLAPSFIAVVNTAVIVGVGGRFVMNGEMTVGMLVAFQLLTGSFSGPLANFVGFGNTLQEMHGDMNRLDDVLQHEKAIQFVREYDIEPFKGIQKLSGKVEFRDVSFGYNRREPPLIQSFNLTIEPGQRVAIVGRSGSGKSTIARLLTGLVRPWDGEILLDGFQIADVPPDLVANSLAAVDQDIFLFEGTVKENLTMWDLTIPERFVTFAVRDAMIEHELAVRPGDLNAMVAEGGRNFSGGQRQRLEIARALVNNPSILVLDEATSALDAATEQKLDSALRARGCTCLIVAHRLSTVRDADRIIVMDRGQIVEQGRHRDLVEIKDGIYASLISE